MELKLGKKPARKDTRTLKLSTILKALPPIPPTFDIDAQYPGFVDDNMYLNDTYGDCVIAGRGHATLRFERFEQGKIIPIGDSDISTEYFKETGGGDTGLVMLDSLNEWRQTGWKAANETYKIHAFASVDWTNHIEVMAAIYLMEGIYLGFQVPQSALDQFKAKHVWDVVPDDGGIQGGHCIYTLAYITITGYNAVGPVCMTWGKRQQMTWQFFDQYVDECYIVIDERDSWVPSDTDPLDVTKLEAYLSDIINSPSQKISVLTMSLLVGYVGIPYSFVMSAQGGIPPYNWYIGGGTLPDGLTMTADGTISGTPTTAGTSLTITFMVADSVGNESGVELTLTVKKNTPTPSPCKIGNGIAKFLNIWVKLLGRKGRYQYVNPGKDDRM